MMISSMTEVSNLDAMTPLIGAVKLQRLEEKGSNCIISRSTRLNLDRKLGLQMEIQVYN